MRSGVLAVEGEPRFGPRAQPISRGLLSSPDIFLLLPSNPAAACVEPGDRLAAGMAEETFEGGYWGPRVPRGFSQELLLSLGVQRLAVLAGHSRQQQGRLALCPRERGLLGQAWGQGAEGEPPGFLPASPPAPRVGPPFPPPFCPSMLTFRPQDVALLPKGREQPSAPGPLERSHVPGHHFQSQQFLVKRSCCGEREEERD